MKKKNGFTLIELLAVIIILGILMIIAIPSVTSYINDSRKEAYVDTAKEIISGARNMVNDGKLGMYDTNVTYYIDASCIKTENASKSPYGEFTKAYVVVTYDGRGYDYYWTSVDETGQGIKNIVKLDELSSNSIESDLKESDILNTAGINGRNQYVLIDKNNNCGKGTPQEVTTKIDADYGKEIVCKRATTLHSNTCSNAPCTSYGYSEGDTITYGQIGISGSLNVGDAFDCDVNYDGNFDSSNERFYYLISNGDNAVLIYYKNITGETRVMYDSSGENWHGPRTAVTYLPTTSTWNNPGLNSIGTRQIKDDLNSDNGNGHNFANFDYGSAVARFLTYQELESSCKEGNTPIYRGGGLKKCVFLFENTMFYNPSQNTMIGYWLETPSYTSIAAYGIHGGGVLADYQDYYGTVNNATNYGVRPAIEVNKSKIGY